MHFSFFILVKDKSQSGRKPFCRGMQTGVNVEVRSVEDALGSGVADDADARFPKILPSGMVIEAQLFEAQ